MKNSATARKCLSLAIAIGAFIAISAPTLAKEHHLPRQSSRLGYAYAPANSGVSAGQDRPGATKAEAIHACNTEAEKYSSAAWQTTQLAVYRTCMAKHGQMSG
jgi:hypothetical protein